MIVKLKKQNSRYPDLKRYSYPRPLNKSGFFEDFFDDRATAVSIFWRVVNNRLAAIHRVRGASAGRYSLTPRLKTTVA